MYDLIMYVITIVNYAINKTNYAVTVVRLLYLLDYVLTR